MEKQNAQRFLASFEAYHAFWNGELFNKITAIGISCEMVWLVQSTNPSRDADLRKNECLW